MSTDDIDRRDVLRTGGKALAAMTGVSLVGQAGAAPEEPCPDCGGGGGGGGGGTLQKPSVRTRYANVSGNEMTLGGELSDTGSGGQVSAWFKWGPEGDGLPYDTPPQYLDYPQWFNHSEQHPGGTYEYQAVASNDAGLTRGTVKTFTI